MDEEEDDEEVLWKEAEKAEGGAGVGGVVKGGQVVEVRGETESEGGEARES